MGKTFFFFLVFQFWEKNMWYNLVLKSTWLSCTDCNLFPNSLSILKSRYSKRPSTCQWAYWAVLMSFLCFALSPHLASLPRRLLTPWPPLACPLDGRRGRTPREELITWTITAAPQPGLDQLCRYSRSGGCQSGWTLLFAWDWTLPWSLSWPRPVYCTSSSVPPFCVSPLSSR